jgi:uncharacterized repeat protein (TIGR01451 family)
VYEKTKGGQVGEGEEVAFMFRRYLILLLAVCGVAGVFAASAGADAPAPGWQLFGFFAPTHLVPGGTGKLVLFVYNVGAAEANGAVTLTDRLPDGMVAVGEGTNAGGNGSAGCKGKETSVFTCETGAPPGGEPRIIEMPVSVPVGLSGTAQDEVEVAGGGALQVAKADIPATFSPIAAGLGYANASAWLSNPDGTIDTQAGSHPYALTVAFALNNEVVGSEHQVTPTGGEARTLDVKLPPGLVGNPTAVPECSRQLFDDGELALENEEGCPADSNVGLATVVAKGVGTAGFSIFNLVPPPGVAAMFGFDITGGIPVLIEARVRSGGDYGITAHTANVPQRETLVFSGTFWGVPAEASHDSLRRGAGCSNQYGCASTASPTPFLTLPTSCQGPQEFETEETSTWQSEHVTPAKFPFFSHNQQGEPEGFTGCDSLVHFEPTVEIAPDTTRADTPAGLSATLKVPQGVNADGLATSGLRNTTVVLPEGVAINPGQATGLAACQSGKGPGTDNLPPSPSEGESEEWDGPAECPAASKVGEDEISTPLLPNKLKGSVYTLQSNPPELKLLVAASGEGVNLKLIGTVHLNTVTGQLTTTFENTPDTPLNEFVLRFSGGAQAALVTPPVCSVYTNTGYYSSSAAFAPWDGLEEALLQSHFQITSGPDGTPCQDPLPFSPTMTAGSTTDQAGGYTDFSMLLQRGDGQQRVSGLKFKAPEGLAGMISQVPLCPEPQANEGTCPASSQIGHTVVGAGPGPYPFYIPQNGAPPAPIYLTGPYDGAPFGLSIVTPVIAGPFNLGTNVVRAKIEVDPLTAQITVTTDTSGPHSIPTILDGIPTDIRSINAVIDRSGFMFNPTNCNPMSFSGTATSTTGATAPLESHFQVGSCQSLKFAPNFKVSTAGKNGKANGASLDAKIVYPTGPLGNNQASSQSNIASVKVDLPKQLPSRLTTLQKACTNAQFEANPAGCPAASLVGHATVITPILPVPLTGPAYFVSHGGEAFPSLIVVLQGDGVTVDLVGTTFISKAGITSSTFKTTPDVPFSSFELVLPQGRYSALTTNLPVKDNYSLCGQKLLMPTAFTAQNGAVIHESTPIGVTGCGKVKKAKKAKGKRKRAGNREGRA